MNKLEIILGLKDNIDKLEAIQKELTQHECYKEEYHGSIIKLNEYAITRAKECIRHLGLELFKEMG